MQPNSDIEERDLKALLESFGSTFSLEDIASAYCEANRNVDVAAEILCTSNSSNELKGASDPITLSSSASEFPKPLDGKRNSAAEKSKPQSASCGIVSGFIGKDYVQNKTLTVPYQEVKKKPLKLDSKELPESEIWGERISVSSAAGAAKGSVSDDVVNFLFKMLGDGFELDKDTIHNVLGLCGYDVQKTVDELLYMSASNLEKSEVHGLAGENSRDQLPDVSCESSEEVCNPTGSSNSDEYKIGLQKEILDTLFTYPQRSEEAPTRRCPVRAKPYGKPVVGMPKDTQKVERSAVAESQIVKEESDDDENSYKVLRKAVKEHWATMKEYYRAAVDAYAKGDHERADRLVEQGNFYNKKAREAEEKSSQKLLQTNNCDDEIPLDLSMHEPKDALSLLKIHLTYLYGIHAFNYLRVIVGTGDEDRRGTKKRLIIRYLEKKSIKWAEEDNGRNLQIYL